LCLAGRLVWLGKIRQAARARYRDDSLDISDCGDKVRRLIEEAVIADGVQVLIKEVSLFSADFDEKLRALQSTEARASEMEHAIRHEIHVKLEEDPAYYQSLRERLEQIIADRKARRIGEAEQLLLLQGLVNETRGHDKAAEVAGMSETGFAIYGLLKGAATSRVTESRATYGDERVREVTWASSTGRRRPTCNAKCAGRSSAGSRPTSTTGTNRSAWPRR
jgi:type I restriction enzyme R subunit